MAKTDNRAPKGQGTKPPAPQPSPGVASPLAAPPSTLSCLFRWFASGTFRHATAMRKHVQKLLNHQRDILSPQAVTAIQTAIQDLRATSAAASGKEVLEKRMESLENTANKWLKPYPNAGLRENVEVLLVALTVAMGIRTFFLQPFKIPTGSMQPTLYGVTSVPDFTRSLDPAVLSGGTNVEITTGWTRVREWFEGVSYIHVVAASDGELKAVEAPFGLRFFNLWQTLVVGDQRYTIWFPPDYGQPTLRERAGLRLGQFFHKGEDIIKMKVRAGDHLFVDRVSYNFRTPQRGEIIVFETRGIQRLPQDQFYIKRMVAMGNEKVQIGDDRHLLINGTNRLDATMPHFEKVYSFEPKQKPRESQYSGHVNQKVLQQFYPFIGYDLAPLFPDGSASYTLQPDHYMVMGDNTMNSLDSRTWGDFPASNVIGKSFFVYWPITERFGVGYHR
jgi:signal peptidase I